MSIEIKFWLEKQTKGTFRYKEEGDNVKVGFLYVKKYVYPKGPPLFLTVTLTPKGE